MHMWGGDGRTWAVIFELILDGVLDGYLEVQ
jgi:hypothetical protein